MQDIIQASKDHEKWLQQVREEGIFTSCLDPVLVLIQGLC